MKNRFKLNLQSQIVLLDAKLYGKSKTHRIRLILDTGASYTMIAPEILVSIGCDPSLSQKRQPIVTASGMEYVSFVTVPKIDTLGVALANIEVCAHSLPPTLPASGLLGINFLRHFDLHLLFKQSLLQIE